MVPIGMKKLSLIDMLKIQYTDLTEKEAYARIICGEVFAGGERVRDPGRRFDPDVLIQLRSRKFVSRGGEKLEPVLEALKIEVQGKVFVDAGASTGGFTDCLLQHGAATVHSVDVGYNQLDYRLRMDPRVRVHERTNILSVEKLDPAAHMAVADLSFRRLRGAARQLLSLTGENRLVALVKPQFEIRPGTYSSFTGVVKSPALHEDILVEVAENLIADGIGIRAVLPSPIRGRKGNREFFFYLEGKVETLEAADEYRRMIRLAVYGGEEGRTGPLPQNPQGTF
jgi:23S rRNA (cytidine1920-2'-O)/16S rRNA (cytidine1409-2'-O)-methyltransferase